MLNSSPHPPICSIRSHFPLSAQASTGAIHLSIGGFDGVIGDYTTNLGSNTNRKHLFSQSPDTPTFQPVADVLAEINPARLAADAGCDGGVS